MYHRFDLEILGPGGCSQGIWLCAGTRPSFTTCPRSPQEISYQRLQLEEAKHQTDFLERQIAARDQLITSAGLVLVGDSGPGPEVKENGGMVGGMATVSPELARRLEALPEGPFGESAEVRCGEGVLCFTRSSFPSSRRATPSVAL